MLDRVREPRAKEVNKYKKTKEGAEKMKKGIKKGPSKKVNKCKKGGCGGRRSRTDALIFQCSLEWRPVTGGSGLYVVTPRHTLRERDVCLWAVVEQGTVY